VTTSVRHDACHGCATAAFSRAVSGIQPSCDQTIFPRRRPAPARAGAARRTRPLPGPSRPSRPGSQAGQPGPGTRGPPAPMAVTVSSTAVRAGTRRYRSSGSGVVDDAVQRVCRTLGAEDPGGGDRPDAHHRATVLARDPGPLLRALQSASPAPGPEPAAAEQRRKRSGAITDLTTAKIRRRSVLGGLINECGQAA